MRNEISKNVLRKELIVKKCACSGPCSSRCHLWKRINRVRKSRSVHEYWHQLLSLNCCNCSNELTYSKLYPFVYGHHIVTLFDFWPRALHPTLISCMYSSNSSSSLIVFPGTGLILWNQNRQKWVGDKRANSRSLWLRAIKLR